MRSRLAVGPEYEDGYLLVEVSNATALAHGAAKPTALDLTLSPLGRLNAQNEPFGRTAPMEPGQVAVREIVLAPIAVSALHSKKIIRGGR